MSRPKPKVLLSKTDRVTYKTEEVLESTAIWAVFLAEHPDKRSMPQIWLDDEYVGGFQQLKIKLS